MAHIALTRPRPPRATISLVPMIDVMLILLVFFMVTSTYLDLDMIPAATRGEAQEAPETAPAPEQAARSLAVRLAADGSLRLSGQPVSPAALGDAVAAAVARAPETPVLILPSGGASMQALVDVMDLLTQRGATRLRVIRLEPRP